MIIDKYFQELTKSQPAACFLLSRTGEIKAVNPAAERMLETGSTKLAGQKITTLVADPEDKVSRYLQNCLRNSEPVPGSLCWRVGADRTVECRCRGHLVQVDPPAEERLVLLCCEPKAAVNNRFIALNKTLEELQVSHHKLLAQSEILENEIAERRKADDAARDSRASLLTILDSLEAIVYVADMQTHELLFVNKYVREIFGNIEGKVCWQAIQNGMTGPCDFCTNNKIVDAEGNPTAPYIWEFQNTKSNRWYYIVDRAVRWIDNRIVRLEIATDITERKQTEKALQESKEFLDSVVENIPNMLFVKDAKELRFVRFNKAGEELLGYRREDLYGKNDYDFFPPAEAEFFTRKDREVLDSKKLLDIPAETIETHHKGRRVLHTKKIPLLNAQGEPEFLLGISEDITEQKRAAAEWGAAMDASEDVIYLLDLERRLVRANKAFYAMTGSTPETALGRHIVELVHPGGEGVPCPVCQAQEEKRDLVLTMEPDHPDNPAGRPLEVVLRIVGDDEGRPISMLMTLHDLAHERKLMEELAKYREHLEELVKARTEEIERKSAELEKLNRLFVGRELRMIELKERIKELQRQGGVNGAPDV